MRLYTGKQATEMNLRRGDVIAVTETHESGWWKGEMAHVVSDGRRVLGGDTFPHTYVCIL